MPDVNTVACGVCGAQKKESNHWWMVWINHLGEFCCDTFQPIAWSVIKERYAATEAGRVEVACGEKHAQELFARWLVAGSFIPAHQRAVSSKSEVGSLKSDSLEPQTSGLQPPSPSPSVPLPTEREEKNS